MKVAVVYFAEKSDSEILRTAKAVARGLESKGTSTELVDGYRDLPRLGGVGYLCFCIEGNSFFASTINPRIAAQLSQITGLSGKRACVFFQKKLIFPSKTMARALWVIESQGVFLRNSYEVAKADAAAVFASRLDVEATSR